MGLFTAGAELIGEVGFRVVKNSAKVVYGGGQTILGVVSEDEELIAQGIKNVGTGGLGLTIGAFMGDDESDDYEDIDMD